MSHEINKQNLCSKLVELSVVTPGNSFADDACVDERVRGLHLFDAPLIGFGDAEDPLFLKYKEPGVIGPWFHTPKEWFPEAGTVISFFFPFSAEVRASNRRETEHCSLAWAYGRIEGQEFLNGYITQVKKLFEGLGIRAFVPGLSPDFCAFRGAGGQDPKTGIAVPEGVFASNWSERHAAYVCGLGTFGLSRGLITEKGIAGRFTSILVSEVFPADQRPYTGIYDYCTNCGACAKRCPLNAISMEHGKSHSLCRPYKELNLKYFAPRFGCGLCQTKVPCEFKRPVVRKG